MKTIILNWKDNYEDYRVVITLVYHSIKIIIIIIVVINILRMKKSMNNWRILIQSINSTLKSPGKTNTNITDYIYKYKYKYKYINIYKYKYIYINIYKYKYINNIKINILK